MGRLGEAILTRLSRDPDEDVYRSERYVAEHADPALFLDTLTGLLPGITEAMPGSTALSVGCSEGMEVLAMSMLGATEAHGIDIHVPWSKHRALAEAHPDHPMHLEVMDATAMDFDDDAFDVVLTCRSFEHFRDPYAVLMEMKRVVRPGGRIFVTSSVWSCPWGAHMGHFTRVPWVQFLFREETVLAVRNRYHEHQAASYAECGVNDVGVASFQAMVERSGLRVRDLYLRPVKGLGLLTRIPWVREFFTNLIAAELVAPRAARTRPSRVASGGAAAPVA